VPWTGRLQVGDLLRRWRERRRLSQLDLAMRATVSTRHLSFLETGRSRPSREMVLHLAEQLDLPLRERNDLLLAAGYAPVYRQTALDSPPMAAVRDAVRRMLAAQEPYPALLVDREWNMLHANAGVALLTDGAAPALLDPPVNMLRLALHPDGLAPRIANLAAWRSHLLGRLRRRIEATGAPALTELYTELRGYADGDTDPGSGPADEPAVPLRLHTRGGELVLLCAVSTFGIPMDVTVAELAVEHFFPADQRTAAVLRNR